MSDAGREHLQNPFNFTAAITDPDLVCGRPSHKQDISYYLEQARHSDHPINLALIGPRASGKTSLLNWAAADAQRRGLCVARLTLSEDDTRSELAFFARLFRVVLDAECHFTRADENKPRCFGGPSGPVWTATWRALSVFDTSGDNLPFLFPRLYAQAMSSGLSVVTVDEGDLERDLRIIADEGGTPVVIMIDEADHLAGNKQILQKMRSLFQRLTGYMLVIAGTDGLFPAIRDVYSAVTRAFVRIDVGPFTTSEEIEECIEKPLQSIGQANALDLIDAATYHDLLEMGSGFGAEPFEIQLVCHFLLKRIHPSNLEPVSLSVEVLDEVLEVLESIRGDASRAVIDRIQSLSRQQLIDLNLLCPCSGRATFDQLWFDLWTVRGDPNSRGRRIALQTSLEDFVRLGLLTVENGIIRFLGGRFDRMYAKYYGRTKKLDLDIATRSPEFFFAYLLRRQIGRNYGACHYLDPDNVDGEIGSDKDLGAVLEAMIVGDDAGVLRAERAAQIMQVYGELAGLLAWGHRKVSLITFSVRTDWMDRDFILLFLPSSPEKWGLCYAEMDEIKRRGEEWAEVMRFLVRDLEVPPLETLIARIRSTSSQDLLMRAIALHHSSMFHRYLLHHDADRALIDAEAVNLLDPSFGARNPGFLATHGFLSMQAGNYARAEALLNDAVRAAGDGEESVLPLVNLGVLEILYLRQDQQARDHLLAALARGEALPDEDRHVFCMIVPEVGPLGLQGEERHDVDVLEVARAGLEALGVEPASRPARDRSRLRIVGQRDA